jgi:dockerin type I repeat protein
VQDFYSHSNWVELGNATINKAIGVEDSVITGVAAANAATCVDAPSTNLCFKNNLTTNLLTSGYFAGEAHDAPVGIKKCRHGGFFDKSAGLGGIAKDSAICLGFQKVNINDAPHNDSNAEAARLATEATAEIFRNLRAQLTDRQFKALLGIGPSLAFAIDTTGSMGSIIAEVRSTAISIVNRRLGTSEEPSRYVLSPFNDPSVGPVTVTGDPDIFKQAINALTASGGGDCPELAMAGILNAVTASEEGGEVFVATDASPKDAALAGAVRSLASKKKVRLIFALFGSCSPFDPAYFFLANNTGGQVFILNRSEAGAVTQLTDLLAGDNAADILAVSDTLSGTAKILSIPIDSDTTAVTFSFASAGGAAVQIRRPDGSPVLDSDVNVTLTPLSTGALYSINAPPQGTWQVTVSGNGDYSLLVNGESTLALDEFRFVVFGGRPGHQGYFPITGLPAPGTTSKALAKISGDPQSAGFEFRDNSGAVISTFSLNDPNAEEGRFLGDVTIPTRSFRTYADGTDSNGVAFQRVLPLTVTPQPVSIVAPMAVDLGVGQVTTYIVQVQNNGATDTFMFEAIDTERFVTSISPATATISSGGNINVTVQIKPPIGTDVGTSDTLTFTASSVTQPAVSNFAILRSNVVAPKIAGDVNHDGIVNCDDLALVKASFGEKAGQRAFNPDVDVDTNAVIDIRDLAFVSRHLPVGMVCK